MTNAKISPRAVWREIHDYVFIFIGMMSYCIGWTLFLLPNHITTGGVAGISSIIFWGFGVPIQFTYFLVNATLMCFALKILGFKFCIKTIYSIGILTVALSIFEEMTAGMEPLLQDQPFMAAVIGATFMGTGIGLAFTSNGSSGGTDIIAAIINKYHDISLGRVILISDIIIVTSGYFVFHDWNTVLYSYVVLYVLTFCIDQVVNHARQTVQFFIISDKYHEIGERINKEPGRGVTIIKSAGFYSGNEQNMLFVMAKRNESQKIFALINDIDPNAFVTQAAVIGVYGKGFDHFKVKKGKK